MSFLAFLQIVLFPPWPVLNLDNFHSFTKKVQPCLALAQYYHTMKDISLVLIPTITPPTSIYFVTDLHCTLYKSTQCCTMQCLNV